MSREERTRFETLHGTGGLTPAELVRFPLDDIPVNQHIKKRFQNVFSHFELSEAEEAKIYNLISAHIESGLHVNTLTKAIVDEFWGKEGQVFLTPSVVNTKRFRANNKRLGVRDFMSPKLSTALKRMETDGILSRVKSADGRSLFVATADE